MDILDILGRTLLSLAANGDRVQVLSPSEGKFFHGPASPRNLAAFIPPAVTLPQALRLLVGALPLSPGPPSKFEYDPAAGQYLLEWRQAEGLQERLWVAAQGLYPLKDEYFGGAGAAPLYRRAGRFRRDGPGLPRQDHPQDRGPQAGTAAGL